MARAAPQRHVGRHADAQNRHAAHHADAQNRHVGRHADAQNRHVGRHADAQNRHAARHVTVREIDLVGSPARDGRLHGVRLARSAFVDRGLGQRRLDCRLR
jgi:hypothetical protein